MSWSQTLEFSLKSETTVRKKMVQRLQNLDTKSEKANQFTTVSGSGDFGTHSNKIHSNKTKKAQSYTSIPCKSPLQQDCFQAPAPCLTTQPQYIFYCNHPNQLKPETQSPK